MDSRIPRIYEKLTQSHKLLTQRLDPYDVQQHNGQLKPPVPEEQLIAFETTHGITLPDDYRQFLKYLGNGGVGPYYGLLPLEKWHHGLDDEVLSDPWLYPESLCDKEAWDNYYIEQSTNPGWEPKYSGAITIGHQGCTYFTLLIVTGELRGRVCYIDLNGETPIFMKQPDFLAWYEQWLDDILVSTKRLGYSFDNW